MCDVITKVCSTCGEEKSIDKFYKCKKYKYGVSFRCKDCERERKNMWKIKKRKEGTLKKYPSAYKKRERTDAIRDRERKYRINNPRKRDRTTETYKKHQQKRRDELRKSYIVNQLEGKGFSREYIYSNPELIEVQRILIKTKRLCKTLKS